MRISRRIFTQNWILDPEIDSTQRAHQNAHLIDQKRPKKHRQKLFLKNSVEIAKVSFWLVFKDFQGYYIIPYLNANVNFKSCLILVAGNAPCKCHEIALNCTEMFILDYETFLFRLVALHGTCRWHYKRVRWKTVLTSHDIINVII